MLGRAGLPAPLAFAVFAALAALALVAGAAGRLGGAAGAGSPVAALIVLAAGLPARAPHDGPLDWLVPAALRAAEYLLVVGGRPGRRGAARRWSSCCSSRWPCGTTT